MLQKLNQLFSSNIRDEKQSEEILSTAKMSAESVHRFSSQYGGENSRGYVANNLAGNAHSYPKYGDFTDACVMRSYGPWWNMCPSAPIAIGRKEPWFMAEDFVDLYYPNSINPSQIEIYETYNPGAVVRILACNKAPHEAYIDGEQVRWFVMWSGPPVKARPASRIFSPQIKEPPFATRLIRIELNQSLCDYYTELDAAFLTGTTSTSDEALQTAIDNSLDYLDLAKLNITDEDAKTKQRSGTLQSQASVEERESCGSFQILPDEIISYLLTFLDFKDIAVLAQCCRFFKMLCNDPVLCKELNLKPFWSKINNLSIESLSTRCDQTEKLDMSWLGPLGSISTPVFNRFICKCGKELTHLRLAVCDFLKEDSVGVIANTCRNLIELNLSSCSFELPDALISLKNLTELRVLNLYRIPVSDRVLIQIFRSCKHLEFVNLGSNAAMDDADNVLSELGKSCPNLRGLDLWRCKHVTEPGIRALYQSCKNIEELDLGWCSNIKSNGMSNQSVCIIEIANNCKNLRKLFLTAVRSTNTDDINALANHSMELEQLDILGTGQVSSESIERLLCNCKKMKMLDVSFCSYISLETVTEWQDRFPHVSIKKSFTG